MTGLVLSQKVCMIIPCQTRESRIMGLLDGILGQLGGANIGALAEKFGV